MIYTRTGMFMETRQRIVRKEMSFRKLQIMETMKDLLMIY
jgi:hypothetical protein